MLGIVGGHVSLNRGGGEEGEKKDICSHRLGFGLTVDYHVLDGSG
jgi:hypothetical protein